MIEVADRPSQSRKLIHVEVIHGFHAAGGIEALEDIFEQSELGVPFFWGGQRGDGRAENGANLLFLLEFFVPIARFVEDILDGLSINDLVGIVDEEIHHVFGVEVEEELVLKEAREDVFLLIAERSFFIEGGEEHARLRKFGEHVDDGRVEGVELRDVESAVSEVDDGLDGHAFVRPIFGGDEVLVGHADIDGVLITVFTEDGLQDHVVENRGSRFAKYLRLADGSEDIIDGNRGEGRHDLRGVRAGEITDLRDETRVDDGLDAVHQIEVLATG